MEARSKEKGYTVLVPFVSLDTPGKATVRVVILADPVSRFFLFSAHMYNMHEKSFSRRVRFLRLLAKCTILANCTISNFEKFQTPNYSRCTLE